MNCNFTKRHLLSFLFLFSEGKRKSKELKVTKCCGNYGILLWIRALRIKEVTSRVSQCKHYAKVNDLQRYCVSKKGLMSSIRPVLLFSIEILIDYSERKAYWRQEGMGGRRSASKGQLSKYFVYQKALIRTFHTSFLTTQ